MWICFTAKSPAWKTPLWTYFEACGWHRGYFGMQVNSPTERRIIFSVWDSGREAVDRGKVERGRSGHAAGQGRRRLRRGLWQRRHGRPQPFGLQLEDRREAALSRHRQTRRCHPHHLFRLLVSSRAKEMDADFQLEGAARTADICTAFTVSAKTLAGAMARSFAKRFTATNGSIPPTANGTSRPSPLSAMTRPARRIAWTVSWAWRMANFSSRQAASPPTLRNTARSLPGPARRTGAIRFHSVK